MVLVKKCNAKKPQKMEIHADTSCCSLSIFLKKLIADNPAIQTIMPVGIKTKYTALKNLSNKKPYTICPMGWTHKVTVDV